MIYNYIIATRRKWEIMEEEKIDYNELADKEEETFCLEAEFLEYQIWE